MKTPVRMLAFVFLAGLLFSCAGAGPADPEAALRKKIADAYGASGFDQIEALRYTFNVRIGDRQISRSWVWEPATDRVLLKSEEGGADYDRGQVGVSNELHAVDARFVNDNYWFLFPLHVYWDPGAELTDRGTAPLPIGPGVGRRLVVAYPAGKGYTPGDVYEIFVDEDFRIRQWIYRKGGAAQPTRITTWEDHRRLGPLTVSLLHRSADESFRLWFTEVGVKLKGDQLWTEPR